MTSSLNTTIYRFNSETLRKEFVENGNSVISLQTLIYNVKSISGFVIGK